MDAESIQVVFETEDGEKMSFVTDLVPAREYKRLQAENAELRELCSLMFAQLNTLVDDRWCPAYEGDEMTPYDVFDRYDELRELGVEVDA